MGGAEKSDSVICIRIRYKD